MTTKIEWVARPGTTPETWNPVTGCTKISEGCRHCYAERMARRLAGRFGYPRDGLSCPQCDDWYGKRENIAHKYMSLGCAECDVKLRTTSSFDVTLHPDRLEKPLRWRKPRTVFIPSMGDLFHHEVPITFVKEVWSVMAACQEHTFLILTKRAKLMNQTVNTLVNLGWTVLPNVWGMVSVENQAAADERISLLLQTPFAVRGVSCEPLLGQINLDSPCLYHHSMGFVYTAEVMREYGEDFWVIAGGEFGPGARPVRPDWLRGLRDQCQAAGVPFFFKAWGAWLPYDHDLESPMYGIPPDYYANPDAGYSWRKVGKKAAGRLLDGREWSEWPEAR